LFRSDDGALHWSQVDSPLNGQQIWSVSLHPTATDSILAGTCPSRIFKSIDGGRSWREAAADIARSCPRIMHTRVNSLVFDPDDPDMAWAGVEIDGLWRSGDVGRSWQKIGRGLSSQDIHALVVLPGAGRSRRLLA